MLYLYSLHKLNDQRSKLRGTHHYDDTRQNEFAMWNPVGGYHGKHNERSSEFGKFRTLSV